MGSATLVRLEQYAKAMSPILVTEAGIVTFARLVQPLKALTPMLVTVPGIVTLVRLLQVSKAAAGMLSVPFAISTAPSASGVFQQPASHPAKQAAEAASTINHRRRSDLRAHAVDVLVAAAAAAVATTALLDRNRRRRGSGFVMAMYMAGWKSWPFWMIFEFLR